jgi:hypothetical protein
MNRVVSGAVMDLLSRPYVWEMFETIAAQLSQHGFLLDKAVTTIVERSVQNILEALGSSEVH